MTEAKEALGEETSSARAGSAAASGEVERELRGRVIGIFVRAARTLGQPKSLGEIYGLLYMSPEPLSMDRIAEELEISAGSASQGLRQLRGFGAVHRVYVPGARKDFFEAEVELRKLTAGFFQEKVFPGLEEVGSELAALRGPLAELSEDAHTRVRVERLTRWNGLAVKLLRRILRFVRF